jgi:hypothetical protein
MFPALAMSARPAPAKSVATPTKCDAEERRDDARTPLCFVADVDGSIRHFLSLVLHGSGIDTEEFADGATFRVALARRAPDLVFLNIAIESAETIECVVALGKYGYPGYVQLMSARGSTVFEHVKSIGEQHRLENAAGAEKAVRDRHHPENIAGLAARPSADGCRPHRSRCGVEQRLDRVLVSAED